MGPDVLLNSWVRYGHEILHPSFLNHDPGRTAEASIDFSEEEFSIDAIAEEGMEVTNMDELVAAKLISPGTEHEVEVKVQNKRDCARIRGIRASTQESKPILCMHVCVT